MFESDKVQFDTDEMDSFLKVLNDTISDISNLSADLTDDLEQLKEDWQTDAGRKFFENHVYDWKDEVNQYIVLLDVLSQMIASSIEEYSALKDRAAGYGIRYEV